MTTRLLLRQPIPVVAALALAIGLIFSASPAQAQAERQDHQLQRADGSTATGPGAPWTPSGVLNLSQRVGDQVTITHSASQDIAPLTGVACPTPPNSYFRVFDLGEFAEVDGGLDVSSVDIGIESVGTPGTTTVNLYTLDGPLLNANLSLIGTAELSISSADDLSIVNVPVSGLFSASDVLVVEWAVPQAGVFFGGNELGQTSPTYIQAPECGASEPTDLATLGEFPDNAWVVNVTGTVLLDLVSIAEARTLGVGSSVTVIGTVSRAKGDFTYIQDDTAGLTIRQTSGAFFDDVADGTISEGTRVSVSGTLSEFANLLQINEGDLDSYEVLSDGAAPAPQAVTLQELVDTGEDYEAELVRVTGLTTDAMGTFAAATSYTVMDGTATDTLRVPNADDSDIDGTMIPEDEFIFTGVVGQFSFDGPNLGYQLLAIEETDIEVVPPTGPASIIIDNGTIITEIFNNGNIGGDCSGTHVGLFYMGAGGGGDILCAASFLIGLDETETIGQNYTGAGAETGWEPGILEEASEFPYPDLDQGVRATFSDTSGLGLDVVMNAYFSSEADFDDFIVLEYEVTNSSNEALTGLAPGLFVDWDVAPFATNQATILEVQDLMYVFGDGTQITSFFGTAVLNGELEGWTCFVDYPTAGQHDPAQIWDALTTEGPSTCAPQDVRGPVGTGLIDLAAGESAVVTFALVGGEDEAGVLANTIAAKIAVGEPVSTEETTQAGTFTLHSAYPNPFATTTSIAFSLPTADHVRLTVYDVLGRRVATLIDGVRESGEQTVRFDASNLGSGTYIYRLEAGGTKLTERFTVVR
jgi:hypothetical protein